VLGVGIPLARSPSRSLALSLHEEAGKAEREREREREREGPRLARAESDAAVACVVRWLTRSRLAAACDAFEGPRHRLSGKVK
jgi:hypothetical protein